MMNRAGTYSNDNSVATSSPPITAIAIGERNSAAGAYSQRAGSIPPVMAMVVMTIGRARF